MSRVEAFLRFLYEFFVGDDWRIAAGVVIAIGLTAIIAGADVVAWWILPVVVPLVLGYSVWHAARKNTT